MARLQRGENANADSQFSPVRTPQTQKNKKATGGSQENPCEFLPGLRGRLLLT